jgi:acetoin utilization protein AcuC
VITVDRLAIVYHEGLSAYDLGRGHPFRGSRFPRFMNLVRKEGLGAHPDVDISEPVTVTDEDLLLAHSEGYLQEVEHRAELFMPLTPDTPLSPAIAGACRLIVGGSLRAAELVAKREVRFAEGVGGGLHHAGRDYGGGFCVFNDVAVCARSLLERHGLERVLILDSDVHAGNGTMDVFYDEPRVLFISVHQDPRTLYPGTGFIEQVGEGPGEGYTVNVPLPVGAGDECMRTTLERVFRPLAREFRPQAIIRNGGSDPHFMDGLGRLDLSFQGLRSIGESVAGTAGDCGCGVVDLCCSGYNPSTVAEGWLSILSGLTGFDYRPADTRPAPVESVWVIEETESVVEAVASRLGEYWSL